MNSNVHESLCCATNTLGFHSLVQRKESKTCREKVSNFCTQWTRGKGEQLPLAKASSLFVVSKVVSKYLSGGMLFDI